jgi:hypothetical protein
MGSLFGSALSMLGGSGGGSSTSWRTDAPTSSGATIGATNVNFGGSSSGAWWLLGGLALAGAGFFVFRKIV